MSVSEQFEAFYSLELTQDLNLPPRISSRYSVKACLASSDRKEVYLLTSLLEGDHVVLRRLPLEQSELNRSEYALLLGIDHPRVPKAIELFEENGFSYFFRSYVDGVSLHQWVASRGPSSERETVDIIIQLCDILTYLHTRQPPIIHRDIKPQNVIIASDGSVYLIDFDISRNFDPAAVKDTTYMGTLGSAPPEQYGYGQTNSRSDIYSLGMLLIFLCTGRCDRAELLHIPPKLHRIAETCTQFAPKDRYASASKMKRALVSLRHTSLFRAVAVAGVILLITGAFYLGCIYTKNSISSANAPALLQIEGEDAERRTAVAEDGTVSFTSAAIEKLVKDKLGKGEEGHVTLSELQSITELSLVGIDSKDLSVPIDFYSDQAYRNGDPINRGKISSLSDLALMKSLNNLTLIYQCIDDLSPLKDLKLQSLTIIGNYVSDLSPLSNMQTLRVLNVNNNPVADISPLKHLQRLEALHIQQSNVTDVSVVAELPTLTSIGAGQIPCLDFSPFLELSQLSYVEITGSGSEDAAIVSGNSNINELIAMNCGITSLAVLKTMPNLKELELSNNNLESLEGIERFQKLKRLIIRSTNISDMSPLISLPDLREIDLRGIEDVDLSPLLQISSLKKVFCSPAMQSSIDQIKNDASFEIEISELL